MIGISRGIGPLGLPVVPAGTPAAAPATAGAAPGAFDAAFADLTAALLATAAGAGQPAAGKGATPGPAAVSADAPSSGDETAVAVNAVTAPVAVPMPAPVAVVPTAPVEDAAGDSLSDIAVVGGATQATASASSPASAPAVIGGAPPAGGAAISSEILGGEDIREDWVDETFTRETRGDDGDGGGEAGPVHTPTDPILPVGLRRQPAPLPSKPAAASGDASSATPGPAAVASESSRTTSLPAGGHDTSTPPVETAPTDGTTAQMPATPPESAAPPVAPGLARRVEALQRALGRRAEAEHGDDAPAGLTTEVARGAAAGAATVTAETPSNGQGASEGGESASQQRRAVRMAAVGAPVANARVMSGATEQAGPQDQAVTASAPTWRAAAMAARFAEPASSAGQAPRQGAAPSPAVPFAAAVVAAEMPALREARPAVIEAPVSLPHEPAGAEHVQMQIVKSMKLQWTGTTQEARVQLKPEYLGEVVANIKVEQGVVTATLHADTPEVRRMLETQTASLRDALVEHGLKLDKVVIAEPETPSGQQGDRRSRGRQPQPESSRPKPRRARDDGGATFELSTE